MAITFDGPNQIIQLDGAAVQSIRAIYSRWADWVALSDNAKYLKAFETIANPPTVPVYAILQNGWRVRPLENGTAYTLTLEDGFLTRHDASDPIAPVTGVEPRIRYQNPVIAVGYDSSGGGFDASDASKLDDIHKIHGLDAANPMTVTPTSRQAGGLSQTIAGDGVSSSTVTRQ